MLKFIIVVVFLVWILWLFYIRFDDAFAPAEESASMMCTDDVLFCADGSMVERSGPSCTFASCL